MTNNELCNAVAKTTGEDLAEIQRMGFSLLTQKPFELDVEDDLEPLMMDWDEYDRYRWAIGAERA